MTRVLFVCTGNICRSPMGEYILKDMLAARGLEDQFYVESAATTTEEIGNPVYPPARAELARHGIRCDVHHARQVTSSDYNDFDVIIAMEDWHKRTMERRFFDGDPDNKIVMCMELAGRPNEVVDDPWYTGRFTEVYGQITEACEGLIEKYSRN